MSLPGHFCFQDQLSSQHFCHLYWQPYRFTNHAYHTLSIIKICWKGIFYKFLGFKLFCWWKCVLYSKIIDLVARLFPISFLFGPSPRFVHSWGGSWGLLLDKENLQRNSPNCGFCIWMKLCYSPQSTTFYALLYPSFCHFLQKKSLILTLLKIPQKWEKCLEMLNSTFDRFWVIFWLMFAKQVFRLVCWWYVFLKSEGVALKLKHHQFRAISLRSK